jgi:8-oxo-dGTP diphosphatase
MQPTTRFTEGRRLYVGGVVFDGSRILLGRRSASRERYPGVWDIFGGHVEPGETSRSALYRELREELGIEVLDSTLAETVRGEGDDAVPFEMTVYLVSSWSSHPCLHNEEHDAIRWFHPNDLGTLVGFIDERLLEFLRAVLGLGRT